MKPPQSLVKSISAPILVDICEINRIPIRNVSIKESGGANEEGRGKQTWNTYQNICATFYVSIHSCSLELVNQCRFSIYWVPRILLNICGQVMTSRNTCPREIPFLASGLPRVGSTVLENEKDIGLQLQYHSLKSCAQNPLPNSSHSNRVVSQ